MGKSHEGYSFTCEAFPTFRLLVISPNKFMCKIQGERLLEFHFDAMLIEVHTYLFRYIYTYVSIFKCICVKPCEFSSNYNYVHSFIENVCSLSVWMRESNQGLMDLFTCEVCCIK